ncbi:MAG: tRNA pseudouridine(55) synthase TruB [Phycisphaerae bacterium]
MDGIIVLDKPAGISSAKALYKVRKLVGQKKSGHAGTLDPAATGVLVLCLGKATKLVEQIMGLPKAYRAAARLDVTSESFDSDRPLIPVDCPSVPDAASVAAAMQTFEGDIEQMPPAVSALKIGGRRAYRMKIDVAEAQLRPRAARIYWLKLHAYDWPTLDFEMACGRGTYVRSVIRDWGAKLSAGGCLTALRRTQVGPFHIDDSWTLERIETQPQACLIPLERAAEMIASEREPPLRPC